jgi:AcrR family transcriptional regulator
MGSPEVVQRGVTAKAERTRAAILESALTLFRERGFDATTMREVARRAGVSSSNAYYYFASKDHLVQGFYAESHLEHLALCEERLESTTDFAADEQLHARRQSHIVLFQQRQCFQ